MTVRELLARISSRELSEWIAFYAVEPWGVMPDDLRTGIITSAIANTNRDPKKQKKPFTPQDFIPHWEKPQLEEPQSADEQKRIMQAWEEAID